MILIELCAGTAAVSWEAVGAPPFPVSRIGSKRGYAKAILEELGNPTIDRVCLVEKDPALCAVLRSLVRPDLVEEIFGEPIHNTITIASLGTPNELWKYARGKRHEHPAYWLIWAAGARGGVGGFKGRHCHRPSVDGFIPSLRSLAERVESWRCPVPVNVVNADASSINPSPYPSVVYFDPPYPDSTGYGYDIDDVLGVANRWADAGHLVAVSGRDPLPGWRWVDITDRRVGQARRSLTTTTREILSISR